MAIIILCLWSPSPKHRHDLHRHRLDTLISIIPSWSSCQLLLLQLSLTHSEKAKQLHGACILCNKETTIRLLLVVGNKTWSESTKSCPIITWDGVVFNGEHLYVDHIYYMIHVRPFGLQCFEAMCVHAMLVKFNPSILHVQKCLPPIVCERRAYHTRSSCAFLARRIVATVHTQGEHLYLEI